MRYIISSDRNQTVTSPDGILVAIGNTADFERLRSFFGLLGHGARILNAELADCQSARVSMVIVVPDGLEFWYTQRLQASGLLEYVYPETQAQDPSWSVKMRFSSPPLTAALRNPLLGDSDKYRVAWQAFTQSLKDFARGRREDFFVHGSVAPLGTSSEFMFRAEIKGRALTKCDKRLWEKLTVNAAINGFNKQTGSVNLSLNFSDGNYAVGSSPPNESRWDDNEVSDGELGKLQSRFEGVLQRRSNLAGQRCL